MPHAHTVYKHMAEHGIVVRYRGMELHCAHEQNENLLTMLRETQAGIADGSIPLRDYPSPDLR